MTSDFEARIRGEQRTINDEIEALRARSTKLEEALQTYLDLMGSAARQAYRDLAAMPERNGTAPDVPEPAPVKPAKSAKRASSTCPKCGVIKGAGAGMAAHMAWHERHPNAVQPKHLAQILPCRFCSEQFGAWEPRREHEQTCEVRLRDHLSLPHEHHWVLQAPKGNWVHGKCKGCGREEDFPSEPSWATKPLTKSAS